MFKHLLAALVAAIIVAPSVSLAGGVVVEKEDLVSVLSGYHGGPDASYWERLDPTTTIATLKAIIEDESVFPIARSRAMAGLILIDGGDGTAYLGQLTKTMTNNYLRASAYDAFGRAAGEKGITTLANGLSDKDTMVRVMTSRRLSRIGGEEARTALKKALATEENPTARKIMEKSLAQ